MSNSEHDATGKMPEPAGEVELRDAGIADILSTCWCLLAASRSWAARNAEAGGSAS